MNPEPTHPVRLRITVRGAVQGVGFRPFLYRLAADLGLNGWVTNSPAGVVTELEGPPSQLEAFLLRLERERPPRSSIQSLEYSFLDPVGLAGFTIQPSQQGEHPTVLILPDVATCSDCLRDIRDPDNRRYLYPFTNCTNCGPRFSIIEKLPYDRPHTTMKRFTMCAACRAEYEDPLDRRFHAQPNACPACGPQLEQWDGAGQPEAARHKALLKAAEGIRLGAIVAVKGLGGFHLVVDARREEAVRRLREKKHREEKPLAVMYPTLEDVKKDCEVSALEERLLTSAECPIVLLRRRREAGLMGESVTPAVAPGNPYLGAMLPYTPLHHLLLSELDFPVVATSGNLSDEPISIDEREAVERLHGIADIFLVHNRPIARHVDDSVVRVAFDRELVLRRARGYAPLPITLGRAVPPLLAVGGHLKNTVALAVEKDVFVSQHVGDLETSQALEAFRRVIRDLQELYGVHPNRLVCDMHPDYVSTQFARRSERAVTSVQHHHAHVVSCMAENDLAGAVLGVSWDGTGYGLDETVWGGEFLVATEGAFRRLAHFRTFPLPGAEAAVKEPRRAAVGILHEIYGEALFAAGELAEGLAPLRAFRPAELAVLRTMLAKGLQSPRSSSVGRLFDAVSSLLGLRQISSFEGQAAMELEFQASGVKTEEAYRMELRPPAGDVSASAIVLDWRPLVEAILEDIRGGVSAPVISAKFHNGLAEAVVEVARRSGERRVVLTGGCFQNSILTERAVHRLRAEGFRPYWHQRIPPNDGGIALGQIVVAAAAGQGE